MAVTSATTSKMSLNYDVRKVKGWADIPTAERDAIIWLSMAVDMGAVTEKNWTEFAARVATYQSLFGAYWSKGGQPEYVQHKHVRQMIGLTTNVSTKTRNQWAARMVKLKLEDHDREIRKYVEAESGANTVGA